MDFSTVKAMTIPEGSVSKITDSSGRILWKKAEEPKLKVIGNGINTESSYGYNEFKFTGMTDYVHTEGDYNYPIPATTYIYVRLYHDNEHDTTVKLNGNIILSRSAGSGATMFVANTLLTGLTADTKYQVKFIKTGNMSNNIEITTI